MGDYGILNTLQALLVLKAWSHWFYVVKINQKYFPAKKQLKKGFASALDGLKQESRGPVLRLAKRSTCVSCNSPVGSGVGDHIIPLSKGGPHSAENFMPLCRKCNSSKGDRDLIEWWMIKGRNIKDLDLDALVIYLRLRYRLATGEELKSPAPWYLVKAIKQAEETLPDELKSEWYWNVLQVYEMTSRGFKQLSEVK